MPNKRKSKVPLRSTFCLIMGDKIMQCLKMLDGNKICSKVDLSLYKVQIPDRQYIYETPCRSNLLFVFVKNKKLFK